MPRPDAEAFLKVAHEFRLGDLVTEAQHPDTVRLSQLARDDLPGAIDALKRVDVDALQILARRCSDLGYLAEAIRDALADGNRVFVCGCGATGRLALSLEVFARNGDLGPLLPPGAILGVMAGGDTALVRSIESFEDFPEYGARQLAEQGFRPGDLLIAATEGGETPFVIGAAEYAAELPDGRPPFFLYCNPDDILRRVAPRSRRVIESPGIHKVNLTVGPMAVAGSTRMQASTALMAAIGWAIQHRERPNALATAATPLLAHVENIDFDFLIPFIEAEAGAYDAGQFVLYEPDHEYGITVLTDTTERSPTFSLVPFENRAVEDEAPSLSYLRLGGAASAAAAWAALLGRPPRTVEWAHVKHLTGRTRLLGFDFSDELNAQRQRRTGGARHLRFTIRHEVETAMLRLQLGQVDHAVRVGELGAFDRQLLLKLLLNIHSTLVMGRLGRYQDNLMTYVAPSNNKLIDRAIRYVRLLLASRLPEGTVTPDYETVARRLFELRPEIAAGEAIVLLTMRSFLGEV